MSQSVVVKLDGVNEPKQARRVELSRSEQMLQVTSWSNRLDTRLQEVIAQSKIQLELCRESALQNNQKEIENILESLLEITLPELVELSVVAADHVYFVDRYAFELNEKLTKLQKMYADLRSDASVRVVKKISSVISRLKTSQSVKLEPDEIESSDLEVPFASKELRVGTLEFERFNEDPLVDNSNTAFALYDDWVTTFHHRGKSYGARNIVYSDLSERVFDLNKAYRIQDKSILEIGPFEGGNTKQLFDLGAKSIVALESNREFYFKTSIVKQEFGLDGLKLLFGDCNEILKDKERFPDNSFDFLYASGVLYHMFSPLETIRTFARLAPCIYVNSHVASESVPSGEWVELHDVDGMNYRGRRNVYQNTEHWGGVEQSAIWLDRESIYGIFQKLGFEIHLLEDSENKVRGDYVGFIAKRKT